MDAMRWFLGVGGGLLAVCLLTLVYLWGKANGKEEKRGVTRADEMDEIYRGVGKSWGIIAEEMVRARKFREGGGGGEKKE
ncbi:hypothetical protein CMI37_16240 [Candidatus Pacearchaeota archaeon]|nr:hypothetical protein [Candidatus Pacearchaeota archaeon]